MSTVTPIKKGVWPDAENCSLAGCLIDQAIGVVDAVKTLVESGHHEDLRKDSLVNALYSAVWGLARARDLVNARGKE